MKRAIITILILTFVAVSAGAQTISLRVGEHKKAGRLDINFLEVTDDSRCPEGTTCIWAGNAKVKIAASRGKIKASAFELNSTLKPQSVDYGGYRITFVSLTPRPGKPGQMTMVRPMLVLSITKL